MICEQQEFIILAIWSLVSQKSKCWQVQHPVKGRTFPSDWAEGVKRVQEGPGEQRRPKPVPSGSQGHSLTRDTLYQCHNVFLHILASMPLHRGLGFSIECHVFKAHPHFLSVPTSPFWPKSVLSWLCCACAFINWWTVWLFTVFGCRNEAALDIQG